MSPFRTCALIVIASHLRTTRGGSSGHGKKQCSWWCAACGGQYWRAPNRILVKQDSTDHREAKVFRAHAAPQGTCDNLINALKLLTNQQKDGDRSVGKMVTGLLERSRSRTMDGLRKFIAEDNHEAVKVGDLHRETRSKNVVKPKVHGSFPGRCYPKRCG